MGKVMEMRACVAAILTSTLLASCASAEISSESIRTVSIVAVYPDEYTASKVGVTVFNNWSYHFPIAGYPLHAAVEESIENVLPTKCGLASIPVSYQAQTLWEQFSRETNGSAAPAYRLGIKDPLETIADDLEQIRLGTRADALLVLIPDAWRSLSGVSDYQYTGAGLSKKAGLNPVLADAGAIPYLYFGRDRRWTRIRGVEAAVKVEVRELRTSWNEFDQQELAAIEGGIRVAMSRSAAQICERVKKVLQ